ncbi:MAG: hypothetical protein COT17_07115 [Elusimicrobia bacterium CG08_land_8_20_14_0_20_51_18]|nr:MAG: hypothetical protein COT17_07115 [Elusimicrobia bacterium CG08_land_8_20_14_0_20_51_18]
MSINEKPYLIGRTFLFSIAKGEDLLQSLQYFCHHNQIKCGTLSAIGAVSKATFGLYDQKNKKYSKIILEKELEILSLQGNISLFDDKPMLHSHITFSDSEGKAWGGHLMSGTILFNCEVFIQELTGDNKVRKIDKSTQLPLWISPLCSK